MAENPATVDRGGSTAQGANYISASSQNSQASASSSSGGNLGRRSRGNRGNNNNSNNSRGSKFVPSCAELKSSYYDIGDAGGIFTRVTRDIGEYVATNYDDAGIYRNGLVEFNLPAPVEPTRPAAPAAGQQVDPFEFEEWKAEYSIFKKEEASRKKNDDKVFSLILGQCTDNLRAMFEADARWTASVNDQNDVIGLLHLI